MRSGRNYMIVKIDKQAQTKKREQLPSGIFIPPDYAGMLYNLQYGEILSIGDNARITHPDFEVGDICLFKHTVEDDDTNLVYEEKEMRVGKHGTEFPVTFEHKVVLASHRMNNEGTLEPSMEIYGVIKGDGTLIPTDNYVFLSPNMTVFRNKPKAVGIIFDETYDDEMWADPERIKVKLEELQVRIDSLKQSYSAMSTSTGREVDRLDDLNRAIESVMYEKESLTYEMHREKLCIGTVLHINNSTSTELLDTYPGDQVLCMQNVLYALHIIDQRFLLIDKAYVYGNLSIGITELSEK